MSLYPIVDVKQWARAYNIKTTPIECPKCKNKFEPDIPLAIPGYRGLVISDHGCGLEMPFIVVPVHKDKIEFWEQLRP